MGKGRFPGGMDIEIYGSPEGLKGFKAGRSHFSFLSLDFKCLTY
jgi:hypothetical protein